VMERTQGVEIRREDASHPVAKQASFYPDVQSPFLSGLSPAEANIILAAAQARRLAPGQPILIAGTVASHLFLLRNGQVKYFRSTAEGQEVLLAWLTPGQVFGLGTLLQQPANYLANAEALAECQVLVWDHAKIRALAESYPPVAENALRIVMEYLHAYIERHVAFSTEHASQRLAKLLLGLSHRTGVVKPHGVEIEATNDQLGALGDMTSFTASRLLAKWERKEILSRTRGKILIRTPESLPVD
jgi:CRP/FNR family transcriptional regulator, nitrogen oxide reductase regulator